MEGERSVLTPARFANTLSTTLKSPGGSQPSAVPRASSRLKTSAARSSRRWWRASPTVAILRSAGPSDGIATSSECS
jgi:hypothetical protein